MAAKKLELTLAAWRVGLLVAAALFALPGCGGVQAWKFNTAKGLEELEGSRKEQRPPATGVSKIEASVVIQLDTASSMGCVVRKVEDEAVAKQKGESTCSLFPAASSEYVVQKATEAGSTIAIYFEEFGRSAATILTQQLTRRFTKVEVQLAPGGGAAGKLAVAPKLDYYQSNGCGSRRTFYVTLVATPDDAEAFTISANNTERIGCGHLAWGIPVIILTFPIGPLIVMPIMQGINDSATQLSLVKALDAAAAELADKMAARQGATAPGPVAWHVRAELAWVE